MLHYSVSGCPGKPVLVFLHGVSNSNLWWATLTRQLEDDFHVFALDSLGHGQSRRFESTELSDPFGASVAAAAEAVDYIHHITDQSAVLVGHSMGGAIATVLGAKYPELVRGLLLADPAWLSAAQRRAYADGVTAALERTDRWATDPATAIVDNSTLRSEWSKQEQIGWVWGQANVDLNLIATGIVSFSDEWTDLVSQLRVPARIITSDGPDCLVRQSGIDKLVALGNPLLSGRLLPGGTHSIVPEFLPEFLSELKEFVAKAPFSLEA